MNLPILNREFRKPADEFYHLVPMGEFRGTRERDGKAEEVVQVIDERAVNAIVANFRSQMEQPNFPGLLVDYEHFSYDAGKSSEAAGWITELQGRANGVWGKIRWSDKGEAAISNGRYRLVSPVWLAREMEVVTGNKVRPTRLDSVALTNSPNMRGMVPLSNREEFRRSAGAARVGPPASADKEAKQNERKSMKQVATKLGLSADASEEAVLAEVTKVLNRATELEGKVVPLTNRVTELETANGALVSDQVDADLDAHGVKDDKVRNRLKPILTPMANRAERVAFLEDLQFKAGSKDQGAQSDASAGGRVLNRGGAKTPEGKGEGSKGDEAIRLVQDYKVRNRCSFEDAWSAVRREKPELFQ